jgi:hypothetical protein
MRIWKWLIEASRWWTEASLGLCAPYMVGLAVQTFDKLTANDSQVNQP